MSILTHAPGTAAFEDASTAHGEDTDQKRLFNDKAAPKERGDEVQAGLQEATTEAGMSRGFLHACFPNHLTYHKLVQEALQKGNRF